MRPLVVIETHPVQYHAPVYRTLQQKCDIPVTAIYGSDFSVAGYRDVEFDTNLAWDIDLLSGYTVHFLSSLHQGGARSPEEVNSRGLKYILNMINPAAVLLVGYHPQFYRNAFWHSWQAGYPLLLRAETTDHDKPRHPFKAQLRDSCLRWFYKRFAALLPIGHYSVDHYHRLVGTTKPQFLAPYCVDTAPFEPSETTRVQIRESVRRSLNIAESVNAILFSGKLIPKKAPELLLRAVKQLPPERRDNTVVLFLGDGQLRPELERLASGFPIVNCRFLGFQNQTSLSQFYHAADLLVLPSRYAETWGLVVNEALMHGVPCVVSNRVGCAPDLIVPGQTGAIFAVDDATQLANIITQTISLIGRDEIRMRCREQVARYTVAHAAAGIAEAFNHVANQATYQETRRVKPGKLVH